MSLMHSYEVREKVTDSDRCMKLAAAAFFASK